MSFLKYDDYKQTVHSWIGEIPASWVIKRAGHHIEFITGFAFKSDNFSFEKGIKLVRGDNVTEGKLRWGDKTRYWPEISHAYEQFLLCENDILIGMDGSKVGKNYAVVKSSDLPLLLVQRVARLRTDEHLSYKFLAHLIGSDLFRTWVNLVKTDPAIPHISPSDIRGFPLPFPSKNEQDKIADFLDHETSTIDNLIEKQQQLIKLLKEKRQAVISHAVTKGLNPDAPMKDSGVEWLGEVPKHWKVGKIKNFAKIESGHTPSRSKEEYWVNCNIPWVSLNDSKMLKVVDYIEDTAFKISELGMANSSAHLLPERAVIFTRDASIGLSAITTKPMAVSQHIIAWVCNEEVLIPEFLLLVFYAMEMEFERYTFGATLKTIGMDNIRSLKAVFPSKKEQQELIDWTYEKLNKISSSIEKADDLIILLNERRSALISAAVTGKIDVRTWKLTDNKNTEEVEVTA